MNDGTTRKTLVRTSRAVAFSGLVAVALTTWSNVASAQSPNDQMLAQSLFDQARALVDQGKYAEACPKFAESQRLDPGGGTILNLALCHEREGRLATAYTEMTAALSQAARDGRKDREAIAREHIDALGPRLPKISVHVVEDEEGLEVRLDGSPLRRPAWDVAAGVDPGLHVVEAEAPGRPFFRQEVTLAEHEARVVSVPSFRVVVGERVRPAVAPPATESTSRERKANPLYYTTLTVGTAGIVVGALSSVFWLQGSIERSTNCNEARSYCNEDGLDAASRERTFRTLTLTSLGAGFVGLGSLIFIPRVVETPVRAAVLPLAGGAAFTASAQF